MLQNAQNFTEEPTLVSGIHTPEGELVSIYEAEDSLNLSSPPKPKQLLAAIIRPQPEIWQLILTQLKTTGVCHHHIALHYGNKTTQAAYTGIRQPNHGEVIFNIKKLTKTSKRLTADQILEDFYEHNPDLIFLVEVDGTIIDCNQTAQKTTQTHKDNLIGKPLQNLLLEGGPAQPTLLNYHIEQAAKGNTSKLQVQLNTPRGRLALSLNLKPTEYQNRKIITIEGTDVTEWRNLQDTLTRYNRELSLINKVINSISGGQTTEQIISETTASLIEATHILGGACYLPAPKGRLFIQSWQKNTKNTLWAYKQVVSYPMPTTEVIGSSHLLLPVKGSEGQVLGLCLFLLDGTQAAAETAALLNLAVEQLSAYLAKQQLKGRLSHTENQYKNLFEASMDGIIVLQHGRIQKANPTARALLGLPPNNGIEGKRLSETLNPVKNRPEELDKQLQEALTKNQPLTLEWKIKPVRKKAILAEITITNLPNTQQQLVLLRNITQRHQNQLALKENQARLQTLADNASSLMRMTNKTHRITYYNRGWLTFTGHKKKKLDWTDYLHPNDKEKIIDQITKNQEGQHAYQITYRLKYNDGSYRNMIENSTPIKNSGGEFSGYVSVTTDLTEQQQAEKARRQQQAMLEMQNNLLANLEKSDLLVLNITAQSIITYANQTFCKLTGYSLAELQGRHWNHVKTTNQTSDSKLPLTLLQQPKIAQPHEQTITGKNGRLITVRFNMLLLSPQEGESAGYTLIGENVTQQRQIEEELKETTRQLTDFFENANDLIQVSTLDGRFDFVNRAWKETLGYEDYEVKHLTLKDVVHPNQLENTQYYLKQLQQGNFKGTFETIFVTRRGKPINLLASVNCRYENNKPVAFRAVLYDITERLKAEKAQKLYYSIANQSVQSNNLNTLYQNIHKELEAVIEVKNIFLALTDGHDIDFAYYHDNRINTPEQMQVRQKTDKELALYAIRQNKPTLLQDASIRKIAINNQNLQRGILPLVWLGAPLKLGKRTTGIIVLQSFANAQMYGYKDLELLDFISGQIAIAIHRKTQEHQIHEQSARLQAIFESTSHLMWSVNYQKKLNTFNKNYFDNIIRKHLRGSLLNMPQKTQQQTFDFKDAESEKSLNEAYDKALAGTPQNLELPVKDGHRIKWYEIFLNPIAMPNGKIGEVSGIAHDITQRRNNQLALLESETKFRNIFESFQDLYFRSNKAGRITLVSPSVLELTGYQPEEVLGKRLLEFFKITPEIKKQLKILGEKGSLRNLQVHIKHHSGKVVEHIVNLRAYYLPNAQAGGLHGVARDMTEIRKANREMIEAKELAEKSLKVKEAFLANMSHEIRTPMNGIIGVLDLLNTTNLTHAQADYVSTIKKSSESLLTILNDILDISKVEAGKMVLYPTTIDVSETIDKLVSLFAQQASTKNIKLQSYIDPEVPQHLITDETRLLQILSNLVSNAIKFTTEGSVLIRASTNMRTGKQLVIRFIVKDSGIGIPTRAQTNLFKTFDQPENQIIRKQSGAGLGLAISKKLCTLMGGDIGVISKPGQGSTFWFTILAEVSTTTQRKEKKQNIEWEHSLNGNYHIFVVDDNSINRKVAGEMLEKANCKVTYASDGMQAVNIMETLQCDLIFMDIQMPRMDGVTATQKIKALKRKGIPPIVAMTAYSMADDKDRFINQGLDDYLPKPIKAHKLIGMVKKWLEGNQTPNTEKPTAAPVNNKSTEILDLEVINQLSTHLGIEGVKEVLADFVNDAAQLLNQANEAYAGNDFEEARSHMHTLKGNAGTLGATKIFILAQKMEKNMKNNNYIGLDKDFEKINWLYLEFKDNYEFILTHI